MQMYTLFLLRKVILLDTLIISDIEIFVRATPLPRFLAENLSLCDTYRLVVADREFNSG